MTIQNLQDRIEAQARKAAQEAFNKVWSQFKSGGFHTCAGMHFENFVERAGKVRLMSGQSLEKAGIDDPNKLRAAVNDYALLQATIAYVEEVNRLEEAVMEIADIGLEGLHDE